MRFSDELLALPLLLHGLLVLVDELVFHRPRQLFFWERLNHPFDTFLVMTLLLFTLVFPFSEFHLALFVGLSLVSCLGITKDEWVHKKYCSPKEMWLHSVLFQLHPVSLIALGFLWQRWNTSNAAEWVYPFIVAMAVFSSLFFIFQIIYWAWQTRH